VRHTFLPYGRQEISDDDVEAVVEALRAELITQGPLIERFEAALADYLGARHVVAFANGTAALHGAAFAAGLGPGDEAIASPLSFAASANCVLYQGARPRFVDISSSTWNLDTEAAAAAVGDRTRAVVATSFAGLPVDLEPLRNVRDRVVVIEDASHALGGRRNGSPVGGPGGADLTTFSFHPVKALTTGEGGAVVTEDDELARRLRIFRTHGITKDGVNPSSTEGDWYYEMQLLGFNYRITDFQCALGLSQLGRLDASIESRNRIADSYRELLADEDRIALPRRRQRATSTPTTSSSCMSRRGLRHVSRCSSHSGEPASGFRSTTSRSTVSRITAMSSHTSRVTVRPRSTTTAERSRCQCSRR
jgi:dTDP-4-amino-4,6-dideoxygalactose transaminase